MPKVSVIMPVYNCAGYVASAMDSILAQTLTDLELIVIDDGSKDESLNILRDYESRDARVRVISRPNKGIARSLNDGIEAARSPYLARMDADDIALPERLAKQATFLNAHPDYVLVGSFVRVCDPFGVPQNLIPLKESHEEIDTELMRGRGQALVHPAVMFRKDVTDRIGRYRDKCFVCEDLDLFTRLAEVGKVTNLPEVLLLYRHHLQSENQKKAQQQSEFTELLVREAYERRGLPLPADFKVNFVKPRDHDLQLRGWGWEALRQGRPKVARKHAMAAIKLKPLVKESWVLMACALRGR